MRNHAVGVSYVVDSQKEFTSPWPIGPLFADPDGCQGNVSYLFANLKHWLVPSGTVRAGSKDRLPRDKTDAIASQTLLGHIRQVHERVFVRK